MTVDQARQELQQNRQRRQQIDAFRQHVGDTDAYFSTENEYRELLARPEELNRFIQGNR